MLAGLMSATDRSVSQLLSNSQYLCKDTQLLGSCQEVTHLQSGELRCMEAAQLCRHLLAGGL